MKNINKLVLASLGFAALVSVAPMAHAEDAGAQKLAQYTAPSAGGPGATATTTTTNTTATSGGAMTSDSTTCTYKKDATGVWRDSSGKAATPEEVKKANCANDNASGEKTKTPY